MKFLEIFTHFQTTNIYLHKYYSSHFSLNLIAKLYEIWHVYEMIYFSSVLKLGPLRAVIRKFYNRLVLTKHRKNMKIRLEETPN